MRALLLLGLATGFAVSALGAQVAPPPSPKPGASVAPDAPGCCQGMKAEAGKAGMMGGMHQGGGMMGGMGQQGGGMGSAAGMPGPLRPYAAFAPDKVLAMKEMLELSADQEKQLGTLAEAAKQAEESAHAPAMAAMKSLQAELAKPAPDAEVVRQLLGAHATAEGNMQWIRLKAGMDAKALLSAEQAKHVTEHGAMSHGGMAGHGKP